MYELRGVLVHTGSADAGHYYSYVRERNQNNPNEVGRWLEFNDKNVTFFDPRQKIGR
jgi:ubiquitin carboxyl-terminal hydrolase 34